MHRLVRAVALLLLAAAQPAGATCTSGKCSDQLAIDDLRARIAARCDCAGASNRRAWVRCVGKVTKDAIAAGDVPRSCAKAARRCEAKATCGVGGAVVCCQSSRRHGMRARIMKSASQCGGTVCTANPTVADACRTGDSCGPPPRRDPGPDAWTPVPEAQVADECGLDPALLAAADPVINRPYAVVRHGKLCHEYYPPGTTVDGVDEAFSTTKTLGAVVTGVAAYQTRDLPDTGRKTGPVSDLDRVDHWLDSFTFNPEAHIAHVLAMVAQNADLSYGHKTFQYDLVGAVQINRLSDVIKTAIAQDPDRLGKDVEEFTQRFLFQPLGMTSSVWSGGAPDKILGFTWRTTVREMARLGLVMLNGGMWNGERVLGEDWIYRMTHPSFEDANTSYGYLTWLAADTDAGLGHCAPPAIHASYPHGLSESPDCHFGPTRSCAQRYDVGVWYALGLGGQIIMGQRGLDLVLVAKNLGDASGVGILWDGVRPALVALDPTFHGDDAAFCAAYDASDYAPDFR
jgi:hypothetical protein